MCEEMDPCRDSVISTRSRPFEGGRRNSITKNLRDLHYLSVPKVYFATGIPEKTVLLTGDLLLSKPDAKASLLAQPGTASLPTAAGSAKPPFMPFAFDMMAGA